MKINMRQMIVIAPNHPGKLIKSAGTLRTMAGASTWKTMLRGECNNSRCKYRHEKGRKDNRNFDKYDLKKRVSDESPISNRGSSSYESLSPEQTVRIGDIEKNVSVLVNR